MLSAILVETLAEPRLWPGRHAGGALLIGAAVLIAGLLIVGLRWAVRSPRPGPRPRVRRSALRPRAVRALAAAAVASLALADAAGGFAWQRHYLHGRYAFRPHVSHLATLWAFFRGVHHARVALGGTFGAFFSYPLFGVDDTNRVTYIAHRGPHGSFTPITSCREWRATVDAGHYRYVVTTPARDPFHTRVLSFSPESSWTASDPAAHAIFRRARSGS